MSAATASATAITEVSTSTGQAYVYDTSHRLEALLAENAEFERRRALYRTYDEEIEMLSMRRPLTPTEAYGFLGLFLGAFGPAAYFAKVGYGLGHYDGRAMFWMMAFMNVVCALVGWGMGRALGDMSVRLERASWSAMIPGVMGIALLWAIATGFLGGVIVFVVGGLAGAALAAPVALVGFPLFAAIHRVLERGKMVEMKHVLPAAAGIALTIAAFIIGINPPH